MPHSFGAFDLHGRQVTVTQSGGRLDPITGAISFDLRVFDSRGDASTDFVLTLEPLGNARRLTVGTAAAPALASLLAVPHFGVGLELNGVPVAASRRGAFALDASALALEPSPWLILDAQVLTQLRAPAQLELQFAALMKGKRDLFDTFRFRADLPALAPAQRGALSFLTRTWLYQGAPTPNWHRHNEVKHDIALQTPAVDPTHDPHNTLFELGGFFNGHHAYLAEFERLAQSDDSFDGVLPFRRMPSWDPATRIPDELNQSVQHLSGALGIPARFSPEPGFCQRYPAPDILFDELSFWHDVIHLQIGGPFGIIHDSAQAPIFWPWHTTIDMIWMNWLQCEQ